MHMPKDEREEFKEMELWEHLAELRTRLIRSLIWVLVGLVASWGAYPLLYREFFRPIDRLFRERGWEVVYTTITQGFTLQLQVCLIAGLVVAIPLVTFEVWGFVAPGLTKSERKACYFIFPLSVLFFFLGLACGYSITEPSMRWFADFVPTGVKVLQDPGKYILFMVKLVVSFGVCFQLPLVLMFLCWVGLLTSRTLKEQWRLCVVACFAIAAIATPGGDPFSMLMMAVPLAILYLASIGLCVFVERIRATQEKRERRALSLSSVTD